MRWRVVAAATAVVVVAVIGIRVASNHGAAGGVDIALSHLPPGYAASHGPIAFDPLTGTAHMANLVITRNGAPVLTAGDADVTGIGSIVGGIPKRVGHITLKDITAPPWVRHVDRVEADGLETGTLRDLLDPAAYPNGKPASTGRRPVLSSLKTFGLVLHVEPDPVRAMPAYDITFKRQHASDISARQFAVAPTPAAMRQSGFPVDVLRALAFGSAGDEDLEADVPGAGKLTIGSDTHTNFDAGRLDSYAIEDITFVTVKNPGTAHVAKIGFTGLDATKLLDQWPSIATDPHAARQKLASALHVAGFTLRGLKLDFDHAPLVTVASIDGSSESTQGDFSTGTGSLSNLDIITTGRDVPESTKQALANFGMADFTIDMDGESSFDRGTGHMVVKREDIRFMGLGSLHVTADLDGLNTQGLKTDAAAAASPVAALAAARLIHASFTWDDASLTGRLLHLAALRSGQSEEALRATLALPLASAVAFFPDQPDVADQINAFLDGKHSLSITLAPASPVSVAEISAAPITEQAHLLGVTIKGN